MISLSIPASGEYVHVLRTVAAGVGATLDMSIDEIEDLRLAVDEACAHLLRVDPEAIALRLEVVPGSQGLEATVQLVVADPRPNGGTAGAEQFLTWHILASLTDGAEAVAASDGPAIRFSKARAGAR